MPYPAILRRAMLAVVVAGAMLPVVIPAADMARAASCPEQPLTVPELLALWDDDGVLGFMGYVNHAGRRCYGTHQIGIVGYVNDPPATGYEEPLTVTPSWLTDPGLWLYGAAKRHPEGVAAGAFYPLAWPGDYGELQDRYLHSWVSITARFDDPRTRSCTAKDPTHIVSSKAELRRMCRSVLVITSVTRLASPDTATAQSAPPDRSPAPLGGGLVRVWLPVALVAGVLVWGGRRRLSR